MSAENEKEKKVVKNFKKILEFDGKTGLLIPINWKYPYILKKKDYLAIIIGLSNQYEFERVFLDKIEVELDDDRRIGVGFDRVFFRDNLILEEKFSYKEDNSLITRLNYYKVTCLEDGIFGEQISKSKIKEHVQEKQEQIYQEIKILMDTFGDDFVLYTMRSILKQKQEFEKKLSPLFFDNLLTNKDRHSFPY